MRIAPRATARLIFWAQRLWLATALAAALMLLCFGTHSVHRSTVVRHAGPGDPGRAPTLKPWTAAVSSAFLPVRFSAVNSTPAQSINPRARASILANERARLRRVESRGLGSPLTEPSTFRHAITNENRAPVR